MKRIQSCLAFLLLTILLTTAAQAEILFDGYFIAREDCQALLSIRKNTNPGDIQLVVDMAYEVISKNKAEATHYRIKVKGASPCERWVPVSCGKLLADCREQTAAAPLQPSSAGTGPAEGRDYLLALSWQPAFCQTHQHKNECRNQTLDRYDATHFTLHGLWPQPKNNVYCNVSNNNKKLDKRGMWEQLPGLELTDDTYGDLIETMPGVASYLQRHEWIKHGTCYSTTPEEYYQESIMLTDQVNASAVRDFFAANIGKAVKVKDIKAEFEAAFGNGAGDKVKVKCNKGMISEIWININGEINMNTGLSELLRKADSVSSSCQKGIIDPVGF